MKKRRDKESGQYTETSEPAMVTSQLVPDNPESNDDDPIPKKRQR